MQNTENSQSPEPGKDVLEAFLSFYFKSQISDENLIRLFKKLKSPVFRASLDMVDHFSVTDGELTELATLKGDHPARLLHIAQTLLEAYHTIDHSFQEEEAKDLLNVISMLIEIGKAQAA